MHTLRCRLVQNRLDHRARRRDLDRFAEPRADLLVRPVGRAVAAPVQHGISDRRVEIADAGWWKGRRAVARVGLHLRDERAVADAAGEGERAEGVRRGADVVS